METTQGSGAKSGFKNTMFVVLSAAVIGLGAYGISEHRSKKRIKEDLTAQMAEVQRQSAQTCDIIEQNLAAINEREGIIFSAAEGETGTTSAERITQSIAAIEGVLKKNREMIAELKTLVGERDKKLQRFERNIAKMEKRLKDYKEHTDMLTERTKELQDELVLASQMQASSIDELLLREQQVFGDC